MRNSIMPVAGKETFGQGLWVFGVLMVLVMTVTAQAASVEALVRISGESPFGELENCGNYPTGGTNFVDSEVEPWVEVNPTDPSNIVAIWQQDRWSDGGARGPVAGVSFDAGVTWTLVPIPGVTHCTGGDFERSSDPWVSFGPDGSVYHMSLAFDATPPPDRPGGEGRNAMLVSKSQDGGLTWSDPVALVDTIDPRIGHDKNSLTADPNDADLVYAVWDRLRLTGAETVHADYTPPGNGNAWGVGAGYKGPAYFTRSTDGGISWEPARAIYDPGGNNQTLGNQIVVLPDGTVINFFTEILNSRKSQGAFFTTLALVRSTDQGETWLPNGQPIRAIPFRSVVTITPDEFVFIRDAAFLFDVAVNPRDGTLYAVWQERGFSGFRLEEVGFSQSTDGGFTWSEPIKINQTPANSTSPRRAYAFIPSVAVSDEDVVAVTYYDFRNDDLTGALTDYFAVLCSADCSDPASWGDEVRLTDTSFDFLQAPNAGGLFLGDYEGLASDGMAFGAAFGLTHDGDSASIFFRMFAP